MPRRATFLSELDLLSRPLLIIFDRRSQWLIGEALQAAQDWMINTSAEARYALVANAQRYQRRLIEVEGKLRLGSRCVFIQQTAIDADDLQRFLFQVVRLLRVHSQDLPGDRASRHDQSRNCLCSHAAHGLRTVTPVRRP